MCAVDKIFSSAAHGGMSELLRLALPKQQVGLLQSHNHMQVSRLTAYENTNFVCVGVIADPSHLVTDY
jgi:hypothetical protein